MGRFLKVILVLAVLAVAGVGVYALVADLPAPTQSIQTPLALPGQAGETG